MMARHHENADHHVLQEEMKTSAKANPVNTFWFILAAVVALSGVQWFVDGKMTIQSRGIFLTGSQARCVGLLWVAALLGAGPYLYIRSVFLAARVAGVLLAAGIVAGVAATALATPYVRPPAALCIGTVVLLLALIPGFIAYSISRETKRRNHADKNAEHRA
jgi:p-aminobenzoyl-glutamate transporter AbgT